MTPNPQKIWLGPVCDDGRSWSIVDMGSCPECGAPSVKYRRADLVDAEIERLLKADKNHAAEIERLLGVCKDKTGLLKHAYAEIERLQAELALAQRWAGEAADALQPIAEANMRLREGLKVIEAFCAHHKIEAVAEKVRAMLTSEGA